MTVVIDTNILLAAIIRDSFVRRLLTEHHGLFRFPEPFLLEVHHHRPFVLRKGVTPGEFEETLQILFRYVALVPTELLQPHLGRALQMMQSIDSDDAPLLAAALSYPDAVIWSDDAHLKKQGLVRVLTSREIEPYPHEATNE